GVLGEFCLVLRGAAPAVPQSPNTVGSDLSMKTHRIAVLAGDGIGKEVIPAGIDVLNAAAARDSFKLEFTPFPWGCDFYLRNGRMMDGDAVDQLLKYDAIYLGAIGDTTRPD